MKILASFITFGVLLLLAPTSQAAVINVTSETLYMHSTVTLEDLSGATQTHSSSYLGSVFSGDRVVDAYLDDHYIPMGGSSDDYDHVWIEMNAEFEVDTDAARTTYWMDVETDVYSVDVIPDPDPLKILASADDYISLIQISMDFFVSGGDAEIFFDVLNEGTYAPMTFVLDDLTTSTRVAELASEYVPDPSAAYALLLDGHHYAMSLMVSEQYHDDDDAAARLILEGAEVVKADVTEPPISLLLWAGLVGLSIARSAGWKRPARAKAGL